MRKDVEGRNKTKREELRIRELGEEGNQKQMVK